MNRLLFKFAVLVCMLNLSIEAYSQSSIKAILADSATGEPVSFATVSITRQGASKPEAYVLSSEKGEVFIKGVKKGKFIFKAELMGYVPFEKEINLNGQLDLGKIELKTDAQALDAATVSATGNPIIIKKDTIEYNASTFKTTENDVLEDLLKKLPGVEVAEDGTITANGETITKITIDGKTFFLDDPQLASKNIPAKLVNKLKVIEKKSDQAAFTGIDDGETETVIDLSVKPGMMKGLMGNVTAGGGHDVPSAGGDGDWRFQGAGFIGKFTDKTQISVLLNGNNTNNRAFNDLSGSMMQGMRGGGGGMGRGQGGWGRGNGISTSYMGGVNGAWSLFEDKMDLGANYLYNHTSRDVTEHSSKRVYQEGTGNDLLYQTGGFSNSASGGHRFGVRLEHKFSENTKIIFEPRINFGNGSYLENSNDTTFRNDLSHKINDAYTKNSGFNRNLSTSGFLLLQQRLGIPGRTLTVMGRYSFSNNDLNGINNNGSRTFGDDGKETGSTGINQSFDNNQKSSSAMGRVTYTEPLGNHFYVEANYMYSWNRSSSDKVTYDRDKGMAVVDAYTNRIVNTYVNQSIGANLMYQKEKLKFQIGFSAKPTKTVNDTKRAQKDTTISMSEWNFAPQAMLIWEINDNSNFRLFYRGNSSQPSVSQLIPIPDNTDPLNLSFGNPSLKPYFSHRFNGDFRFNNKQTFTSVNVRFSGGFVQNPIVSAIWYNGGNQYSMPFNGPNSGNAGVNMFGNFPIAKSKFSIANMTRANWSRSSSYVGNNIPTEKYLIGGGELDYDLFLKDYAAGLLDFTENRTTTLGITERLRGTYRSDNLELSISGRTRMNHSWYTISSAADQTTTWNNQVNTTVNWTWSATGITMKADFDYNWYRGYTTDQPSEYILNAEIQKLLFKKKVTLAVKGYDLLGQAKNLTVTDSANYHQEAVNNTLGRYLILSLTYRFGNMDRSKMMGPGGRRG